RTSAPGLSENVMRTSGPMACLNVNTALPSQQGRNGAGTGAKGRAGPDCEGPARTGSVPQRDQDGIGLVAVLVAQVGDQLPFPQAVPTVLAHGVGPRPGHRVIDQLFSGQAAVGASQHGQTLPERGRAGARPRVQRSLARVTEERPAVE